MRGLFPKIVSDRALAVYDSSYIGPLGIGQTRMETGNMVWVWIHGLDNVTEEQRWKINDNHIR